MQNLNKHPRAIIYEIDAPFLTLWEGSGVQEAYLDWVIERISELVNNLFSYDPDYVLLTEYKASIQMLAYTTTELMAQFCAGGFRWKTTDKARFLSPTVDLEAIIRVRAIYERGSVGSYYHSVRLGVWEFLEVSEYTKSWVEAQKLNKQQIAYLLWSAKHVLELLDAEERIPGFTNEALTNSEILDGYIKCESPIESILYMQLVMDGLRPPKLVNQYWIGSYRVDFAIPDSLTAIECDGKKYHDAISDADRDRKLHELGWQVLRFSAEKIIMNPSRCSSNIHDYYPWRDIKSISDTF